MPLMPDMSWQSAFAFQSSMMKRTSFSFLFFFFLIVLDGVVDLHRTADHFIFFGISGWGIDLDYCDVDWFALDMN